MKSRKSQFFKEYRQIWCSGFLSTNVITFQSEGGFYLLEDELLQPFEFEVRRNFLVCGNKYIDITNLRLTWKKGQSKGIQLSNSQDSLEIYSDEQSIFKFYESIRLYVIQQDFDEKYKLDSFITKLNSYMLVYKVMHKLEGRKLRVIKIQKFHNGKVNQNIFDETYRWVQILRIIRSPRVVNLLEFYEDPYFFYVITELISGPTLSGYLKYTRISLSEQELKLIMLQLVQLIGSLHQKGYCFKLLSLDEINLRENNLTDLILCDLKYITNEPLIQLNIRQISVVMKQLVNQGIDKNNNRIRIDISEKGKEFYNLLLEAQNIQEIIQHQWLSNTNLIDINQNEEMMNRVPILKVNNQKLSQSVSCDNLLNQLNSLAQNIRKDVQSVNLDNYSEGIDDEEDESPSQIIFKYQTKSIKTLK
ncbi:hypothetical protein pb186bvf_007326 [Paramecium bursaria]